MAWYENYFMAGTIATISILILIFVLLFIRSFTKNKKSHNFIDKVVEFLFGLSPD